MIIIAIIAVFGVVCFITYIRQRAAFHRKQTESDPAYRQIVSDMKVLVTIITNNPEHYLDITERTAIKMRINNTLEKIAKYNIRKDYYGYGEYYVLKIAQIDILTKLNKLNEVFVKDSLEKNQTFFDNIGGKSLDKQQRRAIVVNENHNLIIAGAGSGKTLTILGKVLYLLKNGILPKEILLIAFTKKSAGELEERVNRNLSLGISAVTFHKLGLDIITEHSKERPDIDDNMDAYIEDYFSKELIKHQDDVQIFLEFIGYYFNIPMELKSDGTLGEKIESEQYADFETLNAKYRQATADERKTIKGEKVKSIEELIIANFLFLNGIKYEYEKEYPYQTDKFRKRYRPDFYFSDYDIYLEHFGVNQDNRCPWLSAIEEEKYIDGMKWKRETHAEYGTKLVETYSHFQSDGKLLPKLKEILFSNNVKLTPISSEEMLALLQEIQTENTNKEFIKLCGTFIKLFKSNDYDNTYFDVLKKQFSNIDSNNYMNHFINTRTLHFISIIEKIFVYYQKRLAEKNAIDFSDMINNATQVVTKNGINSPYKYIIIDEYQDIGMDRYKLIKAIIEKTSAHLMCVGDDWQSIYRFAGSDANLFMDFTKYWGETQVSKIENTYRNSQELINIASSFVMKNEKQIPKMLRSGKSCKKPICIHYYNENNFAAVLERLLDYIVNEYGEDKSILLLGRTNYDIELLRLNRNYSVGAVNSDIEPFIIKGSNVIYKKYDKLKMEFLTVHKAKGLEADNVIILNMKNDKLGFPNRIADDPVLQLLLPNEDNFAFAEERRLFYVALTRTRNKTFLLAPDQNASEFTNEIKSLCHLEIPDGENLIINNPKCPKCKTGRLIMRQANERSNYFLGCSNFPACDFTNNDTSIIQRPVQCPSCGGFLVARKGNKGRFLGCINYPTCKQTAQIPKNGTKKLKRRA
ncbi:MAG: UvrD-helicase domain-containing protein [Endomicrobium sp.]|jgi:DNA helicase-4|nr:UvrD-helicase domain-containing protein [Endomicrobium sp.]